MDAFADRSPILPNENVMRLLRNLVHERAGLYYDDQRLDLFSDRVVPLASQGYNSLLDYYYALKDELGTHEIWGELMNALTVQETYFWREVDQIQALTEHVMPLYAEGHDMQQPLRIWVAACATGEEPLTIAMALQEAGWFARMPIEIVASDASPGAIERAREGRYRERAFRSCPAHLRTRYFSADGDTCWRIDAGLQQRVHYQVANMLDETILTSFATVPVIFCRNAFIYFSQKAIAKAANLFADYMPCPAHLFIGASESLLNVTDRFTMQEIGRAIVYVKTM